MTNIQWTDMTINPYHLVRKDGSHGGYWCQKISPGCANCYSEDLNDNSFFGFASKLKFSGNPPTNWVVDEKGFINLHRVAKSRRVFVGSMTDLFGDWVPDEALDRIFAWMVVLRKHTFQLLTKRTDRMSRYVTGCGSGIKRELYKFCNDMPTSSERDWVFSQIQNWEFPQNIWVGTSVEDQHCLDKRSFFLHQLHIKGCNTFYSVEPLLGQVHLDLPKYPVRWVIVGGESGKKSDARICRIEWIESVIRQCQFNNIPVFVKQLGTNPRYEGNGFPVVHSKGGDFEEFPASVQIRQFPREAVCSVSRR